MASLLGGGIDVACEVVAILLPWLSRIEDKTDTGREMEMEK